jgi:hypothetical protein
MTVRTRQIGLLLAGVLLLAGCGSSRAATKPPAAVQSPGAAMTPGMVMPDGSTMGASAAAPPSATAEAKPSKAALMICAAETRSNIKTILGLKQRPVGTSAFSDQLYTCTYQLPMGMFVLSVKESPNAAATTSYYQALRQRLGTTAPLDGLGEAAYGTANGTVVLRKDNGVLHVDATGLPAVFGSQHTKRTDFAYEIASTILGCWTGDDE